MEWLERHHHQRAHYDELEQLAEGNDHSKVPISHTHHVLRVRKTLSRLRAHKGKASYSGLDEGETDGHLA